MISFKIIQGLRLLELDHQVQLVISPTLKKQERALKKLTALLGMQRLTLVSSWLKIPGA